MEATELIDEFEEYLKEIEELPWGNHQILCDQAVTILRQQQEKLTKYELRNIAQCDRVAVLEAQLRKAQATCNGFCGEYECKENQSNCKRKAQEK